MIRNSKICVIQAVIFSAASIVSQTISAESNYTNTQAMPVGNTAPPQQSGQNPNPESPAVYPQNQEFIQKESPSKDKNKEPIIRTPNDTERQY